MLTADSAIPSVANAGMPQPGGDTVRSPVDLGRQRGCYPPAVAGRCAASRTPGPASSGPVAWRGTGRGVQRKGPGDGLRRLESPR